MKSVWRDGTGAWRTTLRGRPILADPRINKGTAFSEAERDALGITGLIPPARMTLAEQAARILTQYHRQSTDLGKNVLLTELRDRTWLGDSGRRYEGADMIGRIWDRALRESMTTRYEANRRRGNPQTYG